MFMTRPGAGALLSHFKLGTLELGVFCAEPVNEVVHAFASRNVAPNYVNCYWASEHGGIVWGVPFQLGRSVRPNASTWPLPWIAGGAAGLSCGRLSWAPGGEQGDVVIHGTFPCMATAVWKMDRLGTASWRGDDRRWGQYFVLVKAASFMQATRPCTIPTAPLPSTAARMR